MAKSENRTILNRVYFNVLCTKTTLSLTFTEYGKAPRANRGYGPRRNLETVQAPTCCSLAVSASCMSGRPPLRGPSTQQRVKPRTRPPSESIAHL